MGDKISGYEWERDSRLQLAEGMALLTCIARGVPESLGTEREKLPA